jgi:predicted 3-demethylubiquinone-9 3-methyltransferase (glyoxalase superfamily)
MSAVSASRITPFLWFDTQAEAAAQFYTAIFPNSKLGRVARYGVEGPGPAGSVMTIEFVLDGQAFVGLNGGPLFKFTEAVSFVVDCADQQEIDYYWERLGAGGAYSRCGWLKDRFGLSWQVVPKILTEAASGPDRAKAGRVMQAMMTMDKLDVAALQAAAGERQS